MKFSGFVEEQKEPDVLSRVTQEKSEVRGRHYKRTTRKLQSTLRGNAYQNEKRARGSHPEDIVLKQARSVYHRENRYNVV